MSQNAKSEPSTNPKDHDWELTEDSECDEKWFECQKCGYLVSENHGRPSPGLRIPIRTKDEFVAYSCDEIIVQRINAS